MITAAASAALDATAALAAIVFESEAARRPRRDPERAHVPKRSHWPLPLLREGRRTFPSRIAHGTPPKLLPLSCHAESDVGLEGQLVPQAGRELGAGVAAREIHRGLRRLFTPRSHCCAPRFVRSAFSAGSVDTVVIAIEVAHEGVPR